MSETTEQPVPGSEPAPEPQPAPAGDTTGDTTDAPEQEEERKSRGDRRFAELTAKLSAAERREAERERELDYLRRQAQQVPQADETPEQRYHRERAQIRTEVEAQIRTETFHQAGAAQFTDWRQRCDDLVKMGADSNFAQLLVEMPGGEGVKVAAALAADPSEVERIASLRTERARAVALGKYAATLDDAPHGGNGTAQQAPAVTRAPAPIRPVTGRVSPTFNEYTATPDQLADHYMRQNLERQQRR